MKKYLVAGVLLLAAVGSAQAGLARLGVRVAYGRDYPVLQLDEKKGPIYGVHLRLALPIVTAEPYLTVTSYGSPDFGIPGLITNLPGSRITAYGVDVLLGGASGLGLKTFLIGGVGYYRTSRDAPSPLGDPRTDLGWSGGMGVGIGLMSRFEVDVRGKFILVPRPQEAGGTDKSFTVTGGATLWF